MKKNQNILVWLRKLVVAQHKCRVLVAGNKVQDRSASAERVLIDCCSLCFWFGGLLLVVPHLFAVVPVSVLKSGFKRSR
jgi:hypothetical protein